MTEDATGVHAIRWPPSGLKSTEAVSSQHPREIVANKSRGNRACRRCPTRILRGCRQQVVRVRLVKFGERHDTRTNGKHYTPQQTRRPTNQVSAWQTERESRTSRWTRRHPLEDPREDVGRVGCVSQDVTRMLRGCYQETDFVEFKLLTVTPPPSPNYRQFCVVRTARP